MAARKAWTGQGRIGHHVVKEAGELTEALERHFHLSPERSRELLDLGAVYLNSRRAEGPRRLTPGDYLRVHIEPKRFELTGIDWGKAVVSLQKEFLIANKPFAVPVHATLDNARENTLQCLREALSTNLLVTQRLDVPVGGLLLFARTEAFQKRFNRWLSEHKVRKLYRALSASAPPIGRHVHFMAPSERSPKRIDSREHSAWLRCELTVHSVQALTTPEGTFHEIEVELHTGRTHQIRAQLAFLGAALAGDRLYGSKVAFPYGPSGKAIGLYSCELGFPEPGRPPWSFRVKAPWGDVPSP